MSRHQRCMMLGGFFGVVVLGLAGASYGLFLHMNPEYRESTIREQLSKPHPDNPRYVAAIVSLPYQGLIELVLRNSIVPLIIGGLLGAGLGSGYWNLKNKHQQADDEGGFTLIEFFVSTAIILTLVLSVSILVTCAFFKVLKHSYTKPASLAALFIPVQSRL